MHSKRSSLLAKPTSQCRVVRLTPRISVVVPPCVLAGMALSAAANGATEDDVQRAQRLERECGWLSTHCEGCSFHALGVLWVLIVARLDGCIGRQADGVEPPWQECAMLYAVARSQLGVLILQRLRGRSVAANALVGM